MTIKLRGCPFCGSNKPAIMKLDNNYYYVICDDCGACGPLIDDMDISEHQRMMQAVGAWNERTSNKEEENDTV